MTSITGMRREYLAREIANVLESQGIRVAQLEQRELRKALKRWKETFAPTQSRRSRADLWTPLAFEDGLSVRDEEAIEAYFGTHGGAFLCVLDYEQIGFRCESEALPSYTAISQMVGTLTLAAVYLVGGLFDWTFVVTSEQDAYGGPFFCDART